MAYNRKSRKNVEPEAITEEVVTETEAVSEEPVAVYGKVTGCSLLNVRSEPRLKANVLGTIKMGMEVEIDESASTRDFYKIHTKDFDGFCMKKFITKQ